MNYSFVSYIDRSAKSVGHKLWKSYGVFVLSFLFFASTSYAQSANTIEIIDRAKKTTAPVVCFARDPKTGTLLGQRKVFGTAFLVDNKGTFITADHVIAAFSKSPWSNSCFSAIGVPVGGWKRENQDVRFLLFDLTRCQINELWDVAVCRTTNDLTKDTALVYEVAALSSERPLDGTSIFFTGFPLQATDPITSIGAVAGFTGEDRYNTILIDKNAWPGVSGCPIFLATSGSVVGMLTKTGTGDAAGISFGVAGERLVNILSNARVNWAKEEGNKPKQ